MRFSPAEQIASVIACPGAHAQLSQQQVQGYAIRRWRIANVERYLEPADCSCHLARQPACA